MTTTASMDAPSTEDGAASIGNGCQSTGSRYQFLPPLPPDQYAALREDIEAAGIRVPLDVDEDGNILDGHHRKAIADELGVDAPTRLVAGLDEDGKRQHAIAVNAQRRQLTPEQRRELIAEELARDPDRSDRAIARIVGVDHKTVGAVRRGGWGIPHPGDSRSVATSTREEAEERTRQILVGLAKMDLSAMMMLIRGVAREHIVGLLVSTLAGTSAGDHEEARTWWAESIVKPRIAGVYAWPDGHFRAVALDALTWEEWPDYDAELAEAAKAELAKLVDAEAVAA